ncbi:hypothetical protein L3Q82_020181 [Scortum barcoo]|uniref:Uncharacterized protein n=1 Tax=Scortum barcoo TaxID=214431 RepID=A0ACB8VBR5_9TELE|nr:hypothetical protein L3Q82_020181 [Scortum barcoo]
MQKGLKKYFVNMDEYLCSLGLYRKMVARDASSLFRAVSEQLYYSQNYHQRIRQDCANFMRANRCNFEPFVEGSFEKYLERLEDPKETVGQVEIKALSQLYRRCFLIYRYPGKPATVISEDDFVDKVTLCCSINGHYDIVYPRSYPASAALCQSFLYELLYTQVFGLEEAELCQAMEAFRVGGRRYRNSPSMCSDIDIGYDTPEDRGHREEAESGGATEEKPRAVTDNTKVGGSDVMMTPQVKGLEELLSRANKTVFPAEAPPPSRLSLPYKVMKSLDGEVYRNLEFDVWQDTCKEMQKTDYMVFAGRQYFLGDKCQVRLESKGKYYNAFIQEVGTHSSAVTVFIEELGEKHLVPLTDLKPVNPVPAWNVAAPSRKGDLETTVPTKRVRCFSNNKPWVTPDLRALLLEKRRAFQSGDRDELRRVQRDLKRKIKECKASYRRKMEDHLQQNNAREVWRGLQAISGQVPKTSRPKEPNHFRPVALTSHLMKALERIVLRHLRPLVSPNMDPLQFAYQPGIGVDDAVIYLLLQRSLSHLEGLLETLTVCPRWWSAALVPTQGTVLSPFLFTLYTSDFTYSTDSCHLQKFSDDTAIVGCVSEGNDCEYRKVIMDFVDWCELNHLQVNASKTKEMVIDFSRKPSSDIAPDLDSRQRHHRHRYFRKSRGSNGVKGAELLMPPPSSYGGPAPSGLPPRFQPAGHPRPPPPLSPGAMTYDPYAPPHHHHPTARAPRYGASRSSTRFLNRHLIGPQLTYYHPSRRYYHDYENYAFRSRRSRRQLAALNKECQFGFSADAVEEPTDLDPTITYYQLDDGGDAVFPPLPVRKSTRPGCGSAFPPWEVRPLPLAPPTEFREARGPSPLHLYLETHLCVHQRRIQEDTSTVEDQAEYTEEYIYITPDQSYPTSGVYAAAETSNNQDEQEERTANSPPRPEMNYSYTQQ